MQIKITVAQTHPYSIMNTTMYQQKAFVSSSSTKTYMPCVLIWNVLLRAQYLSTLECHYNAVPYNSETIL